MILQVNILNFSVLILTWTITNQLKIDALLMGILDDLKNSSVYHEGQPNTLEIFITIFMNTDNKIRSRKVKQEYSPNTISQPSYPINSHPSYVSGGLTPMEFLALRSQPITRSPLDQRYTFVNETRKISATEKQWRCDELCPDWDWSLGPLRLQGKVVAKQRSWIILRGQGREPEERINSHMAKGGN